MQLSEPDGGAHDTVAKRGDSPAPGAGDLRDEPVDVEAVEEPTDLGTLRFRVIAESAGELCTEVAVGEAVHGVLPAHEGDEEQAT